MKAFRTPSHIARALYDHGALIQLRAKQVSEIAEVGNTKASKFLSNCIRGKQPRMTYDPALHEYRFTERYVEHLRKDHQKRIQPSSPSASPAPEGPKISALEVGNSIIELVDRLRNQLKQARGQIKKLRDENKTLNALLEDYDRLQEDNRAMHERITDLSTRASASNLKSLQL